MSKERGDELFRALHSLLDAVTNLNLRDLEAEAKAATASEKAQAESSTQGASTSASASSKGKAKDRILIPTGQRFRIMPFLSLHCLLDLGFLRL
jgi:hypothetical protein